MRIGGVDDNPPTQHARVTLRSTGREARGGNTHLRAGHLHAGGPRGPARGHSGWPQPCKPLGAWGRHPGGHRGHPRSAPTTTQEEPGAWWGDPGAQHEGTPVGPHQTQTGEAWREGAPWAQRALRLPPNQAKNANGLQEYDPNARFQCATVVSGPVLLAPRLTQCSSSQPSHSPCSTLEFARLQAQRSLGCGRTRRDVALHTRGART